MEAISTIAMSRVRLFTLLRYVCMFWRFSSDVTVNSASYGSSPILLQGLGWSLHLVGCGGLVYCVLSFNGLYVIIVSDLHLTTVSGHPLWLGSLSSVSSIRTDWFDASDILFEVMIDRHSQIQIVLWFRRCYITTH